MKFSKTASESAKDNSTNVYYGVVLVSIIMIYWFLNALVARPVFCTCLFLLSITVWFYMMDQHSFLHKSQQTENKFWMFVSYLFACALFFALDSPFYVHEWQIGKRYFNLDDGIIGCMLVVFVTTAAHYVDKQSHRSELDKRPMIPRGRSTTHLSSLSSSISKNLNLLSPMSSAGKSTSFLSTPSKGEDKKLQMDNAEDKYKIVQAKLNALDIYLPSNVHNILYFNQVLQHEKVILKTLSESSKDELNYIILQINLRVLIYKIKNHNIKKDENNWESTNGMHRNAILHLLAIQRVSDLTTTARAIVIDAIQTLRLTANPLMLEMAQNCVMNILLKTTGDQLSELKTAGDCKGSVHSTHKLLYEDVKDIEVRQKILRHFKAQAATQAAHMSMGSSIAKRRQMKQAWRKIISDVDDTLLSSGGRYPAGIDDSFPHHVLYPGVMRFYTELDLGVHPSVDDGHWDYQKQGNMVFLSARPHVYKDMAEKRVYNKFERMIHVNNLHTMPTLLPGDVESGQAFMLRGDFQPMALKKFRNFEEYYSIFPEYKHIFIGDNGQADVKAGELMKISHPEAVECVFIHQVQPLYNTFGYTGKSFQTWKDLQICFFKTYVEAATLAATRTPPLIRISGLRRVAMSARTDFIELCNTKTWAKIYDQETRRLELNQDIIGANLVLEKHDVLPIPLVTAECLYPVGSSVFTSFGEGIVQSFDAETGIYKVVLDWRYDSSIKTKHTVGFFPLKSLFKSKKTLIKLTKKRQLNYCYAGERSKKSFNVNDSVLTPFGKATIEHYRWVDDIYEVSFDDFSANGFLKESSMKRIMDVKQSKSNSIYQFVQNYLPQKESHQHQKYGNGCFVETAFGNGIIQSYSTENHMYRVILEWGATSFVSEKGLTLMHLEPAGSGDNGTSPLQKAKAFSSNLVMNLVKLPFSKYSQEMQQELEHVFLPGSQVKTLYGDGIVVESRRKEDHIIKVQLAFGTAYIYYPPPAQFGEDKDGKKVTYSLLGQSKRFRDLLRLKATSTSNLSPSKFKTATRGSSLFGFFKKRTSTLDSPRRSEAADNQSMPEVMVMKQSHPFNVGTIISSPYGVGKIIDFHCEGEGQYVVQFTSWSAVGYLNYDDVKEVISGKGTAEVRGFSSSIISFINSIIPNRKLTRNNSLSSILSSSSKGDKRAFRLGETVNTPFGSGIIIAFRSQDKIYEIRLPFGMLYVPASKLKVMYKRRSASSLVKQNLFRKLSNRPSNASILGEGSSDLKLDGDDDDDDDDDNENNLEIQKTTKSAPCSPALSARAASKESAIFSFFRKKSKGNLFAKSANSTPSAKYSKRRAELAQDLDTEDEDMVHVVDDLDEFIPIDLNQTPIPIDLNQSAIDDYVMAERLNSPSPSSKASSSPTKKPAPAPGTILSKIT